MIGSVITSVLEREGAIRKIIEAAIILFFPMEAVLFGFWPYALSTTLRAMAGLFCLGLVIWIISRLVFRQQRLKSLSELLIFCFLVAIGNWLVGPFFNAGRSLRFSLDRRELQRYVAFVQADLEKLGTNGKFKKLNLPNEFGDVMTDAYAIRFPDGALYVEMESGILWPASRVSFVFFSGEEGSLPGRIGTKFTSVRVKRLDSGWYSLVRGFWTHEALDDMDTPLPSDITYK